MNTKIPSLPIIYDTRIHAPFQDQSINNRYIWEDLRAGDVIDLEIDSENSETGQPYMVTAIFYAVMPDGVVRIRTSMQDYAKWLSDNGIKNVYDSEEYRWLKAILDRNDELSTVK